MRHIKTVLLCPYTYRWYGRILSMWSQYLSKFFVIIEAVNFLQEETKVLSEIQLREPQSRVWR